jgi:hypothetical protein
MSREIKFRVWDILGDRMLQWGDIFDIPAWEIFPGTPEQRAFNVMQYTGKKDCKGNEYYDGDHLGAPGNLSDELQYVGVIVWDEEDDRWEVKAPEGRFEYIPDGCEVIGNIYETPELIHGT